MNQRNLKYLVLLTVVLFSSSHAQWTIHTGANTPGSLKLTAFIFGSENFDMSPGVETGVSYEHALSPFLGVGPGINLLFPRKISGFSDQFACASVYGEITVRNSGWPLKPFAFIRLGYSGVPGEHKFKDGSHVKGGMMRGIGMGIMVTARIGVEFSGTVHEGKVTAVDGIESLYYTAEYRHRTIGLRYSF